ncbi:hypothetical protein COCVIDRAFT_72406, partial [Bipolaris victoriae FI3]
IAIAGATSGIGLAFRQQLDEQNSHEYIILVRKPLDHDPKAVIVDYSSTAALADTLRTYAIHTVISALSISDEASGVAQLRLIEAASQSKCVQRFLPSEFGADYHEGILDYMPSYGFKFKARNLLAELEMEYSIVSIGLFLDYYCPPSIPSALDPNKGAAMFIDLQHRFAAVPGDGSQPIVLTHSTDAARFVVAMLDLPSWSRDSFFAGERTSLVEFLQCAEKILDVKFEVHYDDHEKIEAGNITLTPNLAERFPAAYAKGMVKGLALEYLRGRSSLPYEKCRNEILPDGKWLEIQQVLHAWK